MALSGSVSVEATPNNCNTLVLSWEATQNRVTNTSTIEWTLKFVADENYGVLTPDDKTKDWYVTIDGQNTTGVADITIANGETKILGSGSTEVKHESDGTKTFEIEIGLNVDITGWGSNNISIGWVEGSDTFELETIVKSFDILRYINGYIMGICAPVRAFPLPGREPILPDVPEEPILPDGYTLLDYIETTDAQQYIDTGFIPNHNTRIVCEFMYLGNDNIYGARYSTNERNFSLRVKDGILCVGYVTQEATEITVDTNWHIADHNKNMFYLDGTFIVEREVVEFEAPKPFIIGGIYSVAKIYYGSCRYRSCEVYDNEALIRDLVPCLNADGVAGMYDRVDGVFYGNSGTGEFVLGYK